MMPFMENKNKAARMLIATLLILILASCQTAIKTPSEEPYSTHTSMNNDPLVEEADSPQKTYIEDKANTSSQEPYINKADTTNDTNAELSNFRDKDKANVEIESNTSKWSQTLPKLNGMAIGDSSKSVTKLFGKEKDRYKFEEEDVTIEVLEYDGFAVGFDEHKSIHYIEVYGKKVATGLSSLKIGDTPDQAIMTLGKPTTQTTFLLTYIAEGAFLKLDLDPEHDQIVSIKLLKES